MTANKLIVNPAPEHITMDSRQVVLWVVPLVGHHFDLEELPRWFSGQEVHVKPRDNGFALVIPSTIVGYSCEPVRAFAEERLALINGIGRLLGSSFRPVSLDDKLFGLSSAGAVCNTVRALSSEEMRVKGGSLRVVIGGELQPDPAEGAASPLMRAVSRSSRAHDALIIIGRQRLTWSELYLLFELVQAEVGRRMYKLGWISRSNADLFTQTANSYSVLRSGGRHGKDRGDPPTQPMQHDSAVILIRALVLAWLSHVGALDDEHKAG